MTTPTDLTTPDRRTPLRLRLAPTMGHGALDGSWWPQSRDLPVELADLVDNFPSDYGEVRRVVFSRPDWDTAPHRVRVGRGLLKVGSFPRDDTHQVWLSMSTHTMIRLSVTAPDGTDDHEEISTWNDEGGSWWDPHPVAPSERI